MSAQVKIRSVAIVVLGLCSIASPQYATAKQFMVMGYGNASCGDWIMSRKHTNILTSAYNGWIEGYLTGFNEWNGAEENIADGTDIDGIDAAIDKYCAANPLSSISEAADDVLSQLIERKNKKLQRELAPLLNSGQNPSSKK